MKPSPGGVALVLLGVVFFVIGMARGNAGFYGIGVAFALLGIATGRKKRRAASL